MAGCGTRHVRVLCCVAVFEGGVRRAGGVVERHRAYEVGGRWGGGGQYACAVVTTWRINGQCMLCTGADRDDSAPSSLEQTEIRCLTHHCTRLGVIPRASYFVRRRRC